MVPALKIAALATWKADACAFGVVLHVVSLFVCVLLLQNSDGASYVFT